MVAGSFQQITSWVEFCNFPSQWITGGIVAPEDSSQFAQADSILLVYPLGILDNSL
jgi:hypothetical protein